MAESTTLLTWQGVKPLEGSNPSLSADLVERYFPPSVSAKNSNLGKRVSAGQGRTADHAVKRKTLRWHPWGALKEG